MEGTAKLSYDRRFRPKNLDSYIGNDKLKKSVLSNLASGNFPQSILLWGNSGCGKTSMARLVAKEYNCENRDPVKGACCECENCKNFDEYIETGATDNLMNIKEVDIASENGKRDLDAIVEDMMIPSFGWKVYILDECHKATDGAQNRLLKIVEEPPEHVLVIFCTTEPEKILPTLRNRCAVDLKVNKPTVKELSTLSAGICRAEDVEFDKKGLEFLANRAECTIRSNLKYLERVINEEGNATYESITKIFEEVSNVMIVKFFKLLKSHDVFGFINLLYNIKTSIDLPTFVMELLQFTRKGIYVINGIELDGVSDKDLEFYRELFGDMGVEELSALLIRLNSFDNNNIEMELLTLGYTGITPVLSQVQTTSDLSSIDAIESINSECNKEQAQALKVLAEQAEAKSEKCIDNANKLTEEVDFDAILQMGGILVSD